MMIKSVRKLINMPLKTYGLKQGICFLYMIVYSLFSLIFPGFVSYIVDEGIMQNNIDKIVLYCIYMIITGLIMIGFQYLAQISFYKLAQEIIADLKEKLYGILINKNIRFWSNNTAGDMFTVLESDVGRVENLVTTTISEIIVNLFIGMGIATYLVFIDFYMGIGIVLLSLIFAYAQKIMGNKAEEVMQNLRMKMCSLNGFTDESLNNMLNIQVSGYAEYMKRVYAYKNRRVVQSCIQQMKLIAIMRGVGNTFNVLGILAVLVMGAIRVRQGNLSIGLVFSLTIYVQRLYAPIVGLGTAYIDIRNSKPIIKKILSVIEDTNNITTGTYLPECREVKGKVEFKNLTFAYEQGQYIFKNFNLTIEPNTIVGVLGDNGSGKSTLLKIFTKLCVPTSGEVLLDGYDIENYDTCFLREQIGFMQQNEFFFKGKLRTIVDPYNQMEHKELLKLMDVFKISVDLFPYGLDTEISENMLNLSGGEVQKLAMVRLFCENKPIYILDEPTAALDIDSEEEITLLLKVFLKGKTAIIITHREKILDICDTVVRL